jgi:superfamily II DNA or RNA helicase
VTVKLESGQRVRIPGKNLPDWVTVDEAIPNDGGWKLYVKDDHGVIHKADLLASEVDSVTVLNNDGAAASPRVLAGLWTQWMAAAGANANATLLASVPLRPYAHQSNAVYGAMLTQPKLRFLLADEPGTGKTIMAGLYLREMQKLGLVTRGLVVAPAGLVTKWQADFSRFFGGELRRITNDTIQQHGLSDPHDMWIVSLELAAVNPNVQDAIRTDRASWDVVVFDEAHRLTPTAESFHRVGRLLAMNTPRVLLMTATPHRGSEYLFRHLLHLVDPHVFPHPGSDPKATFHQIKPGPVYFLRRMKEDLVDYDGVTKLFKGRMAHNEPVPLNSVEYPYYQEALDLVDEYFPTTAAPLAKMVYGKRAASTLYALAETLKRRRDLMGSESAVEAVHRVDPDDVDETAQDEARVTTEASKSARAEKKAIGGLLARLEPLLASETMPVSKWEPLIETCFAANGIRPGNSEQAVIFTEYTDSANWIVQRLESDGFTARRYSGSDLHSVRDQVRAEFMAGKYQIIVSTDAGNEGIDLQSAHVLVNYDIPWSLVRLEQRMGRIHRVGQTRNVELYNLIAQGTREGEVLNVLLDNFVKAANELSGQMFDSLSLVAELAGMEDDRLKGLLADTYGHDEDKKKAALAAVEAVTVAKLKVRAQQARREEAALATTVDVAAAIQRLNSDTLQRINPAIVEAYLRRLEDAKVLSVSPTAAGDGIFRLRNLHGALPKSLGSGNEALIASSGKALTEAQTTGATLTNVIPLGPGEPAFRELVTFAQDSLGPDLYRGGTVTDPTAISDYSLFAFEGTLVEADGKHTSPWATLVKVGAAGARGASWESLANLVPSDETSGPIHPGHQVDAEARAEQLAAAEQQTRQDTMRAWLVNAGRELRDLPNKISNDIAEREERVRIRGELNKMVAHRIEELDRMANVTITDVRLATAVSVKATGIPPNPTEKDSEAISMKKVHDLLSAEGFRVSDVHTEELGYDLYATRGQEQRCVEVKGVWESAASQGIRMTGNEILIAAQQRADFWLYVVDQCSNRVGELYGIYQDPVATFEGLLKQDAIFTVSGSALKAARDEEGTA